MQGLELSFSKTLNPSFSIFSPSFPKPLPIPFFHKVVTVKPLLFSQTPTCPFQNAVLQRDVRSFAGRRKKNSGEPSTGRIDGDSETRREAKKNAHIKSKKMAESYFYRLNKAKSRRGNHPDNFTEEELEMIGLGYDRMVRFMDKDDPRLRHPYDWYKYGEFGPYSWRGIVVGEPIRGRFSDENVTLMGEVRNHEEWEKIEQHEMAVDFSKRLKDLDNSKFRYFWVFVRHPRWRLNEFPWQQWTLVSEVVLEAGKERIDKWNLMGRLGNKTRSKITQCAAWFRPDIVYVKKPVYQCRFEPEDDFFKALVPLVDPKTEKQFLFELEDDEGRVDMCTYYAGLCKIVKVNPKSSFVDDVVNAYEKMSDEKKSKCLEFLLGNHPVPLLHPYTKEWKAKLEEMELGCDAPEDDEEDRVGTVGEAEFTDWVEDEDGDDVLDIEGSEGEDEEEEEEEEEVEEVDTEEDEKYWEKEFEKAVSNADKMERLAKRSVEMSTARYEKQLKVKNEMKMTKVMEKEEGNGDGEETRLRGARAKITPDEWTRLGYGPWRRRIRKSRIPPELFLRAAVRPFTYRNLVKEIVLTRHGIVEGEIGNIE